VQSFGSESVSDNPVRSYSLVSVAATVMKEALLKDLAKYPLCDFFLGQCVKTMSDKQVTDDLAEKPDLSLLFHVDKPDQMGRLEEIFAKTMKTFGLSNEELKAKAGFNFDVYDMTGFESVRGVFRLANALSEFGFTQFGFLKGKGLADLSAIKDGQRWFIEVKTLVLQTKPKEFDVNGTRETLEVDKFQPETCAIEEYVEAVSKQIAGNPIEKARQQLIETLKKEGEAKKMVGLVVNLFAADFFLDAENLSQVYARLRGKLTGWEKDYLADIDALAFLTSELHLFL
jgi:hypothetical protein